MVYGIVADFYATVRGSEKSVVKFLIKNEVDVSASSCTICAELPNDALKYDMVKAGSCIAWQNGHVYLEIEGVKDVAFRKVGNSAGDIVSFYEHLRTINKLEEKGSKGI